MGLTATEPAGGDAATHAYAKAAVVACLAPEIQSLLDRFRRENGLNNGMSTPHHPPGAALNILDELPRLDMAVRVLGATEIHVVDHADPVCKAYVEHYGGGYNQALHEVHLEKARIILQERYPSVVVRTWLLRLPDQIIEITD